MLFDNLNGLRILQWNARGISNFSTVQQLNHLILNKQIDIVLVCETFLNSHHKFKLSGYKIYRNDRSTHGGGVAIAIKYGLKHDLLNLCPTVSIENISIIVYLNTRSLIFTSAYCGRFSRHFSSDIHLLTSFFNSEFFIFGDFNAKHLSWNNTVCNAAGNSLFQVQNDSNFFIHHPISSSYVSSSGHSHSTLDILLSNSNIPISDMIPLVELNSDHYPVVCTINLNSIQHLENKVFDFKAANWINFRSFIESRIDLLNDFDIESATSDKIDHAINIIIKAIIDAKVYSIPQIARPINSCQISDTCKSLITHRNYLRRRLQRCDLNLRSMLKSLVNQCNSLIDINIFIERNINWNNVLSKLQTGCKKFWFINKCIRGKLNKDIPALIDSNCTLTTDIDKAEAISDWFAKSFQLTIGNHSSVNAKVRKFVRSFDSEVVPNDDTSTFSSPDEIISIIANFKTSKSPGFDGIQNILMKKLPFRMILLLTIIINSCIKIGYFPDAFKCAKVVPIRKPGKNPNLSSSYRPISLLSCLGKVFEKVIANRINLFNSINNVLPDEQFGFRPQHSTIHQVCRIKNMINLNKSVRKSTGMILLDVEKAFDSIWHDGLIYKMHHFNFPNYILKLIRSFCSNRSFRVCIGNSLSSNKSIPAGVPQGSILSPFLYSIYTSDIKKPKNSKVALYADDTALIVNGKLTSAIIKRLNSAIKTVNKFYRKWKINLNLEKSQAIIFPFNKSPKRKPKSSIIVNNSAINFSNEVTYLGITLDSKLTFASHINKTCIKASNCLKSLYPVLNRKSRLSLKNKNLLFKSIIRPILTYGAPIWRHSAWSHRKKLQIIQNKCLKIIEDLPWRFPTVHLHNLTKYQFLDDHIESLSTKFFDGCAHSSFQIIRNIN